MWSTVHLKSEIIMIHSLQFRFCRIRGYFLFDHFGSIERFVFIRRTLYLRLKLFILQLKRVTLVQLLRIRGVNFLSFLHKVIIRGIKLDKLVNNIIEL